MARAYVSETIVALSRKHEVERDEYERHSADNINELSPRRLFHLRVLHQHVTQVHTVKRGDDRHDDEKPHVCSFAHSLTLLPNPPGQEAIEIQQREKHWPSGTRTSAIQASGLWVPR